MPTMFSYSTASNHPGDGLTIAAQVPYAVTTTGRYAWKLELIAGALDQTVSGSTFVVAQDASPFGAGWTFGPTDRLVNIAADPANGLPAGILRVYGNGGYRFYSGASLTSPANDNGALTTSGGGHVYTDAGGARKTFDANGNQTSSVSADGHQTTQFSYDGAGRLAGVTTPDGGVSYLGYNASGQVASVQGPGGRLYTLGYSGADLTTVTNPDGGVETYSYSGSHKLIGDVIGSLSNSWAYGAGDGESSATWGSAGSPGVSNLTPVNAQGLTAAWSGQPTAISTDPTGHISNLILDGAGRLTKEIRADGSSATWARDALTGYVLSQTDFLGRTTTFQVDALGYVTSATLPGGATLSYVYQAAFHALVSTTDARGGVTTNAYDAQGHLTSTTAADGGVTTYGYTAEGLMTSVTDPLGHTTAYAYDADRRLTALTDALGHTTTYQYDGNGNLQTTTDALGRATANIYDAMGRLTQSVDASGATSTKTYDKSGVELSATDALGRKSQPSYDGFSRGLATQNTEAFGTSAAVSTQTWYDAAGRAVKTQDADGKQTSTAYDALGQATLTTDAAGGVTRMVYDADGEVTKVQDALGRWTSYGYDANGFQTSATDALGRTTTMQYDAAGRVSTITDADGREQVYAYDAADRLTGVTWLSSGGATVNQLTYTYDNNGNQLTATDNSGTYTNAYDAQNRLISQTNPSELTLTYSYDAAGRMTQRADSLGGVLNYVYDNADRLTSEQFGGAGQTQSRVDLGYDNRNELIALTRYADTAGTVLVGTTTYSYDAAGRVVSITNKNASAALLSNYGYTYDVANRVTSEAWQSVTATGTLSGTHTYSYDVTNQLTADGATPYSYDANGNRTMTGYQTGTDNRVTNDGTYTYTYDPVGDIVKKSKGAGLETWYYGYDTLNRLTSIRETSDGTTNEYTVAYTYDVLGNREIEDVWQAGVGETVTRTAVDGGKAWADLTSANVVTTRYVWGAGAQDLYARIDVGVGLRQVSQDRLGSVRDVWDGSGVALDHVEYAAYGTISSETAAALGGHFLYTGLWENRATGTVDAHERTLFVDIGRRADAVRGHWPMGAARPDHLQRRRRQH
jgi:YD repeat-containing protein